MANNDYITTDCKLTVSKNTAKLDEEIFLYKNDRNIKLLIEIVDNKYRYKSDDLSNLLVKYKASYAQVKWYKNAEVKKEFPIQATDDGKVVFVIEGQLIDEDTELGDYDLQLRLLNESQESIRSLPIIKGAVHILKPLFEEGDIATVNSAVADISMLSLDGDAIDTYNSDGTYNQTNWGNGDVISSAKLNKLEKVAKDNVDKVNKMPAKSIVEGGKIYLAKEDGTKLDSGTELPTSSGTDNTIKLGNYIIQYNETDDTLDFMYTGTTTHYNIHNTLSNCSSSNSNSTIEENGVYTATITADKGCTLTGATISITMGGIDITSTAYADGKINISNVTGDIMINISAVQKQGEDSVITPTWKANTNISSTGAETTDAAAMVTDFIPVEAGYKYIVNLTSTSSTKISFWNSSKGFISRSSDYSPTGTDVQITFPSNGTATYFRVKTDENATVTRSNVNQYVIIKKVAQS